MTINTYYWYNDKELQIYWFHIKNKKEGLAMVAREDLEDEIIQRINEGKGFVNWVDMDGNKKGVNIDSISAYEIQKFRTVK